MKKCKQGYYYCYTDEVCKPIPKGLKMTARFSGGGKEPEETGIGVPTNGNGKSTNSNDGDGGGMSEETIVEKLDGKFDWGNKSESVEYSDWRDDFKATEYEFVDIIKPEPLKGKTLEEKKEESKVGGGNLKKLTAKAVRRVDADVDGDVDSVDMNSPETGSFVPSPDGKKLKPKVRFEDTSDWGSKLGIVDVIL